MRPPYVLFQSITGLWLKMANHSINAKAEEHRQELRTPCKKEGVYLKMTDEEFEEGGTMVLNYSSQGMLLHVPKPYTPGSIIELSQPDERDGRLITILEVRWSKFHPESHLGALVGCRTLFAFFA